MGIGHKNTSYTHNKERQVDFIVPLPPPPPTPAPKALVMTLLRNVMLTIPKGAWVTCTLHGWPGNVKNLSSPCGRKFFVKSLLSVAGRVSLRKSKTKSERI